MGIKLGECNSQKRCLEDTQSLENRIEKLEKQLEDSQSKDEIIKDLKVGNFFKLLKVWDGVRIKVFWDHKTWQTLDLQYKT